MWVLSYRSQLQTPSAYKVFGSVLAPSASLEERTRWYEGKGLLSLQTTNEAGGLSLSGEYIASWKLQASSFGSFARYGALITLASLCAALPCLEKSIFSYKIRPLHKGEHFWSGFQYPEAHRNT